MYLGPDTKFDDEDLEYLNKDDEDQHNTTEKEESPPSPLIVDLISGIYLGFDNKDEIEEQETLETSDNLTTSSETEAAKDTASDSKLSWKLFKVKQSSNYKVNSGEGVKADGSNCFKFVRKVWSKEEVYQ